MSLLRRGMMMRQQAKDYIKFADPTVGEICADTWGDGKGLTYEEAAVVTSFPDWKSWTGITSFNELQYFQSLSYIGHGGFRNTGVVIDDVRLPALTRLGGHTFEGTKVKRVSDLGSLKGIDTWDYAYTFNGCSVLEYVKLPDTLTSIPARMIISCANLKTLDVGNGVTIIGQWFLNGCTSLQTLVIRASTPPSASSESFMSGVPTSCGIYVPDGAVDAYKAADVWSGRASQIKPLSEYSET